MNEIAFARFKNIFFLIKFFYFCNASLWSGYGETMGKTNSPAANVQKLICPVCYLLKTVRFCVDNWHGMGC